MDSIKLLGLNIKKQSFTSKHIQIQVAKANALHTSFYSLYDMDERSKLILVKALIIPTLTYPCTPLNIAPRTSIYELQKVLNKSLRFVYKIHYPICVTNKSLHEKAKIKPINQTIHNQASKTWSKIADGIAADPNIFTKIINLPFNRPKKKFPSSYARALLEEPPPIYNLNDSRTRDVINYYNHLA